MLELLKEEKTVPEAAVHYGIHVNQLRQWRQRAVDELPALFSREQQVSQAEVKQRDELIENIYGQIGRLSFDGRPQKFAHTSSCAADA